MKLSVSSGNSLDTLYLSMDGEPAQLPGLAVKRHKRKNVKQAEAEKKWEEQANFFIPGLLQTKNFLQA